MAVWMSFLRSLRQPPRRGVRTPATSDTPGGEARLRIAGGSSGRLKSLLSWDQCPISDGTGGTDGIVAGLKVPEPTLGVVELGTVWLGRPTGGRGIPGVAIPP